MSMEPTINATKFRGFDYVGSLSCVTGALDENVTERMSAEPKVGTRLRPGSSHLVLHSGRNGGSAAYGGPSFIAVSYEKSCRFRSPLLQLSSTGIAFAFYAPATRSLVDSLKVQSWRITASKSEEAAHFIRGYSHREDLLLVIITAYNLRVDSSPGDLLAAIEACGGSNMMFQRAATGNSYLRGNYALVARCSDQPAAGHWANLGLEVSSDTAADINVDVGSNFFFENGRSKSPFNFTYDPGLTPYVVAMSRLNGTTAGGTTLRLNVTNLPGDLVGNVSVTLGGVTCATRYNEVGSYRGLHLCSWDGVDCSTVGFVERFENGLSQITCLTNPWDYSGDAKDAKVVVTSHPRGNAHVASGLTWSYIDLWSAVTTWGGDRANMPGVGDSVTITQGQYIVLDISPPSLFLLIVYGGVLEFSPSVGDLELNASYIFVFGGKLVVGTEEQPFPNKVCYLDALSFTQLARLLSRWKETAIRLRSQSTGRSAWLCVMQFWIFTAFRHQLVVGFASPPPPMQKTTLSFWCVRCVMR